MAVRVGQRVQTNRMYVYIRISIYIYIYAGVYVCMYARRESIYKRGREEQCKADQWKATVYLDRDGFFMSSSWPRTPS